MSSRSAHVGWSRRFGGAARAAAGLVGVVLVLGGCSWVPSAASTEGTMPAGAGPSPARPGSATTAQVRPLDAYLFGRDESQMVLRAVQILETSCMAEYGFRLREADAPHPVTIAPAPPRAELFGIDDPAHGYSGLRTPEVLAVDQDQAENNLYLSSLSAPSEAYLLVAQGRYKRHEGDAPASIPDTVGGKDVYPTGCEGRAWDAIAGDDLSEGVPVLYRQIDPWDAAAADPRSVRANQAWSSCMAGGGYQYAQPDDVQWKPGSGAEPTEAEYVTIALADDACRDSTGYAATRYAVLVEYDNAVIEEHQVELSALRSTYDAEVRRAAEIVAEAGTS